MADESDTLTHPASELPLFHVVTKTPAGRFST
jgi:hypothetical protein